MKKVLFFIDSLGHGGAEKVLVNLVNNLDDKKYDITLMTIFDVGVNKKYLKDKIKYRYLFKRLFHGNVMLFRCFSPSFLYKRIIGEKYDVVVSYLEGNTTRILSGCPYSDTKKIAWIHIEMDEKDRFYPYRSREECIRCYEKFDDIVGVSQTVVDSFEKQLGKGFNTRVVYNAVDSEYINKCADEPITDVEFSKDGMNLISVGRLIEQKSYKRLLSVHKRLLDDGIKNNLYIIGEGAQRGLLEKYILENRLEKTAHLLGFKDNPWKYVKNADLFVCSSWKEGFSTAVTEALIVGTPVVTTLCSGMHEMLGESEYGLIVDNDESALYEGIKKLANDRNLYNNYKEKAESRGKFFGIRENVKAVELMMK